MIVMKKSKKIISIIMAVVMMTLSVIVVSKTLFNNTPGNGNEEDKNIQGREQGDRKSTRLNSSHTSKSRMPSSA